MKIQFKRYLALAITLMCVLMFCIVLYFCIGRYETFVRNLKNIISIISPFIYGAAIAYIISPMCNFFERNIRESCSRFIASKRKVEFFSEKLSIICTYAFLCFIGFVFFRLVMPQVIESLKSIINKVPEWINDIYEFYINMAKTNPELGTALNDYATNMYEQANEFLKSGVFSNAKEIFSVLSTRVMGFTNGVLNVVVAVIVSVYVLAGRKTFKAQGRKLIYAVLKKEMADIIIEEIRFADVSFGGFITGKLIDSTIIGIIAFIVLYFMNMPYTMLLAIIIGFTNIIPFFGPIIGAVPGIILILFTSPLKAVYFLIFILVLQQFDGNILGPKILGDKVGIPSFWVLFSVVVFGGMWGVFGMIVGVPVFAVIIDIVTKLVNMKLKNKGLSVNTNDYY